MMKFLGNPITLNIMKRDLRGHIHLEKNDHIKLEETRYLESIKAEYIDQEGSKQKYESDLFAFLE